MSRDRSVSRRRFLLSATTQHPLGREESRVASSAPGNDLNRQLIRHIPPIHQDFWSFTIDQMGEAPQILSYEDTLALPASDVVSALICGGNAAPRRDNIIWRGVPIPTLLERLNIRGRYARFAAADGYATGLSLDRLSHAMLAYAMNGEPLSHDHGFPVRLLAPGYYGYKMPKWITRMEVTDLEPSGFWEARGWSATGAVQTSAAIINPRHRDTIRGSITICGVAYTGEDCIRQIEVNIDDGPWMPVDYVPAPPFCCTEWHIRWIPPAIGDYFIKVRASDPISTYETPSNQGVVVHVIEVPE